MRARKAMPFALAALTTAVILALVLVSPAGRSYTLDSLFFCPIDLENGRHARLGFEWGHFVRPIDANPTLWECEGVPSRRESTPGNPANSQPQLGGRDVNYRLSEDRLDILIQKRDPASGAYETEVHVNEIVFSDYSAE